MQGEKNNQAISGEKQKQIEQQTNTQEATAGYEQQKELVVFCHTQQFVERKPVRQSETFSTTLWYTTRFCELESGYLH